MSANHRFVVRHVRYWRGQIQKWSTVYQYQGVPFGGSILAGDLTLVKNGDQGMCYYHLTTEGGIYQVEAYDTDLGGPPVLTANYFDPETPGAWTGYPGTVWSPVTTNLEQAAETSLGVRWPAGTSSTGKAVYMRKWYHAVPVSAGAAGSVDVSPSNVTALAAQAAVVQNCLASRGMVLGAKGRTPAGTPVVSTYYENHQMPRGRRRKITVTSSGAYRGTAVVPKALPVAVD